MCNNENEAPLVSNKEATESATGVAEGKTKVTAKDKLARMKENYYATRVQACTRGMLTRRLVNNGDAEDFLVTGKEVGDEVKEAIQEIQQQDELAAAEENPDYGYATGNRQEDDENRNMTGMSFLYVSTIKCLRLSAYVKTHSTIQSNPDLNLTR